MTQGKGPLRAVLYVRVSTPDQANDNHVSMEVQETSLRSLCGARGFEVAGVYSDPGHSARNIVGRPAMQQMLQDMRGKPRPFDVVAVYSLSRLTRSIRDLGAMIDEFEARRTALVSLTESIDSSTAAGKLTLNLLGSVAQWEREVISERTRAALRHKKARGRVYTRWPSYGFAREGDLLVAVEAEMRYVREAFGRRAAGQTLQAIGDWLNADGVRGRQGSRWTRGQVHALLRRRGQYAAFLEGVEGIENPEGEV